MKTLKFEEIYDQKLASDAIIHDGYIGFREDYLALHCLLRKYKPKSLLEIGTHRGVGVNIICNAIPKSNVYSLDLPYEKKNYSEQYPYTTIDEQKVEDGVDLIGCLATCKYTQLRGDSMTFDFSQYPCEAYWIDAEHDYDHPFHETTEVLKNDPKMIIWHDSDMEPVWKAINDAMTNQPYELYRVVDTRISYALRIK
jgi:hypothetical protein